MTPYYASLNRRLSKSRTQKQRASHPVAPPPPGAPYGLEAPAGLWERLCSAGTGGFERLFQTTKHNLFRPEIGPTVGDHFRPRHDKAVKCPAGRLRIHAHGDKSGLESGLIWKCPERFCLAALTGIARTPSKQGCLAKLVVSREGHQRETAQLLIAEYRPDLAHGRVPLRPV
jgi:hypothetical protein